MPAEEQVAIKSRVEFCGPRRQGFENAKGEQTAQISADERHLLGVLRLQTETGGHDKAKLVGPESYIGEVSRQQADAAHVLDLGQVSGPIGGQVERRVSGVGRLRPDRETRKGGGE